MLAVILYISILSGVAFILAGLGKLKVLENYLNPSQSKSKQWVLIGAGILTILYGSFLLSRQPNDLPPTKSNFIGTWLANDDKLDYRIVIHKDGEGSYCESDENGGHCVHRSKVEFSENLIRLLPRLPFTSTLEFIIEQAPMISDSTRTTMKLNGLTYTRE